MNPTTSALHAVLIETRDWFENQAKAVSKGCGSSYELHDLRAQRDALDVALAASTQPAAPAQAGEYPELPIRYATYDAWGNQTKHGYNAKDMHAYVDADRAARVAAQAAPVDAARLDWLERRGSVAIERVKRISNLDAPAEYEVTPYNDDSYDGATLRAAIDAARAAQGDANG